MTDPTPDEALVMIVDALDPDNLQFRLLCRYGPEGTSRIFATVAQVLVRAVPGWSRCGKSCTFGSSCVLPDLCGSSSR